MTIFTLKKELYNMWILKNNVELLTRKRLQLIYLKNTNNNEHQVDF